MAVTLQVVGLYYQQDIKIDIPAGKTVTVKAVLDAAVKQGVPDGQFFYSIGQGKVKQYVNFFTVTYNKIFSSPVSKTQYLPGTFALQQTFTELGQGNYTVWQYYVRDKNKAAVSIPQGPETPFGDANVVQDGFTVIWRLVEICKAIPAPPPPSNQALAAAHGTADMSNINARFAQIIGLPLSKASP